MHTGLIVGFIMQLLISDSQYQKENLRLYESFVDPKVGVGTSPSLENK